MAKEQTPQPIVSSESLSGTGIGPIEEAHIKIVNSPGLDGVWITNHGEVEAFFNTRSVNGQKAKEVIPAGKK